MIIFRKEEKIIINSECHATWVLTFRLHAAHVYWCCKSVPSGSYIYKEPNKLPNLKFPIEPRAEINKRANVYELIRMENCVYISTKLYLIANY